MIAKFYFKLDQLNPCPGQIQVQIKTGSNNLTSLILNLFRNLRNIHNQTYSKIFLSLLSIISDLVVSV